MDVGFSIGNDKKLMLSESIADEFLKCVLIPHERSPFAERRRGEEMAGGLVSAAGRILLFVPAYCRNSKRGPAHRERWTHPLFELIGRSYFRTALTEDATSLSPSFS